jgi:hypothetical protein
MLPIRRVTARKDNPTDEAPPAKGGKTALADDGAAEATDGAAAPAPAVRKAIGVKEVPAFVWKLIGTADGYALTLFKSVEREDCDAQLIRVRRDGYYKDLRVVDIDMKIVQPKRPKPAKKAVAKAKRPAKAVAPKQPKVTRLGKAVKSVAKAKSAGRSAKKAATAKKAKTTPSRSTKAAAKASKARSSSRSSANASTKASPKRAKKPKASVAKKKAAQAAATRKKPTRKKKS